MRASITCSQTVFAHFSVFSAETRYYTSTSVESAN